jgi:hypothetical protein
MTIPIIPENRRRGLGQQLAGGLAQGLPQAIQQFTQYNALQNENAALKNQLGLDLTGIMNPETRQALIADQLKFGRAKKEAEVSQGVNYLPKPNYLNDASAQANIVPREQPGQVGAKKSEVPQPYGLDVPQQKPKKKASNRPQEETSGIGKELIDPDQFYEEALKLSQYFTSQGSNTTVDEAAAILGQGQAQTERWNAKTKEDILNRQAFADRYHNLVQRYYNTLPENSPMRNPRVQAYLNGKAEDYAGDETKESAIQAKIAKDLQDLNDQFDDARTAIPRANFASKALRKALGTDRGEKAIGDIRTKVQPLLDLGFHDEIRAMLGEKDYRPELIENVVSNLSENANKSINEMPNLGPPEKSWWNRTPQEMDQRNRLEGNKLGQFQENLQKTLQLDPQTNLILLRQQYGKKGVDWEDFWDTLQPMINNGQFKPTPEQQKQLNNLSQPPLDGLDRLAKFFGLSDTL